MSRFDLGALRSRDELTAAGKDLADEIKSDDVASLAAAVSFKIVLALFPAMVAAIGIFNLVAEPTDIEALLQRLAGVVPEGVIEFLSEPLNELIANQAAGSIAVVVGVLGGLWAASGAAVTLNKALTRAFDETEERKLVKMRGTALLVTIALLTTLIGIFLLLIVGGNIENSVIGRLPLTAAASSALDFVSTFGRLVLAAVVAMLLFAFIYWIGPDYERRPSWAWITPGAVIGVITFLVASGLFGVYTSMSGTYTGPNSIYGSLGSAILFMLWLQIAMFALLLGAEVNQVLQTRARHRSASAGPAAAASATVGADRADPRVHGRAHDDADLSGERGSGDTRSTGRAGVARSARALAVQDHAVARGATPATPGTVVATEGGSHDAAGDRQVPVSTMVGATVAAVSSLVGLVGLFRRLKGE